jgi:hypothetical protein
MIFQPLIASPHRQPGWTRPFSQACPFFVSALVGPACPQLDTSGPISPRRALQTSSRRSPVVRSTFLMPAAARGCSGRDPRRTERRICCTSQIGRCWRYLGKQHGPEYGRTTRSESVLALDALDRCPFRPKTGSKKPRSLLEVRYYCHIWSPPCFSMLQLQLQLQSML